MARLRLGLALDKGFEDPKRWTCICTPRLIEGLQRRFNCRLIHTQRDYEEALGEIDALWSMEPGWGAPLIEFARTPAMRERLAQAPSFVLNSDPHDKLWRQSYFLGNGLDHFAAYYYHPTLYHMGRLTREMLYHFPWAVPDEMTALGEPVVRGQETIGCFGASGHEAYATRNWCKGFAFVSASSNSGVENAVMSAGEYMQWLGVQDAVIAAGSEEAKYRLTTPKYFEIAASGALLFAQETDDLPLLGFRHRVNCLVFNRENFEAQAREYLAHPEEYLGIRRSGRELVRARHTLTARLDELEARIFRMLEEKSARAARKTVTAPQLRAAPPPRRKPRVLFIVDAPNWAHDLKTENLARALGTEYDIRKRYQGEVDAADLDAADLIVVYYWLQFGGMPELRQAFERNRRKVLVGICSNFEMQGERREGALATFSELARAVFVNNLAQYKEFQRLLRVPVFYTPNGVDTSFYRPGERAASGGTLRVGWAGSLTNHGNKRGYHDLIVPACRSVEGIELVTAAREDKWRDAEEMRRFYQSIDVYVCASSEEGTPNPCLEAAACGLPLVTTRVGNMPELVTHGVNGLFVERDPADIAEKLALLMHNVGLRQEMGRRMLESVRAWDWRAQAANYRALFEAVLQMNGYAEGDAPIFSSAAHLYLASADRMDKTLENVAALGELPHRSVDTYATVIGGMSGLNYLLELDAREVVFYDINAAAVEYARLVVEMVRLCETPREFVARFFGRSIEAFLARTGAPELTVENQGEYLAAAVDEGMVQETLRRLTPESRRAWQAHVTPHLSGRVLDGARNCRRLLPCWPVDRRVPVGAGEETGDDGSGTGRRLPNTNTFFYGHGWLGAAADYARVREALGRAAVRFAPFDVLRQDLRCLGDPAGRLALHVSNIDDWFPEEFAARRAEWQSRALAAGGDLTVISSHNGLGLTRADPHERAYHAIAPFVFGEVVEVTHKVPWGFHEFKRQNVHVDEYVRSAPAADTTILHILVGEGLPRETLSAALRAALAASRRVLVMEHNRDSADWNDEQRGRFLTAEELRRLPQEAAGEMPVALTELRRAAGERDDARNLVAVFDTPGPVVEIPPEASEAIQQGVEAVQRQDWRAALGFYLKAQEIAPRTPGLGEAVQRLQEAASGASTPSAPTVHVSAELRVSFCLITNGARPDKLRMALATIRRQRIPGCEAIVVGAHREECGVRYIPAAEAAASGRLGVMRNLGVDHARGEWVVIMDDDILLSDSWYRSFFSFAGEFDILTSRVLAPDGTRYWDYATNGPKSHRLLRYDEEADDYVYMSGGCAWAMRADAARAIRWREELGFYENEDTRFSHACRRVGGLRIRHNPGALAWHDAPAYTRVGRSIFRRAKGTRHDWLVDAPELADPDALLALAAIHCAAGRTAEAADCLRAGAQMHRGEPRFATGWQELQDANGGDPGGDQWRLGGAPEYKALVAALAREEGEGAVVTATAAAG